MAHPIYVEPDSGAERRWSGLDGAIAALAMGQHGVVSRGQLAQLGLGRRAIGHRLERGRLHALYRGVYLVGHPLPSRHGRWMAAAFAGGEGAVLSHRSAAALWGLSASARAQVEVSVAAPRRRRRGIEFHRTTLPLAEVTARDGIPVTTVPRTLLDLGRALNRRQLERAINEAEVLRLWDETSLSSMLDRHPRRPGTRALRAAIAARREGATVTRSELEERFLTLVAEEELPRPRVNTLVMGFEVDAAWVDRKLAVELDGRAAHATVKAFEADRERDRILQAAGWRVIRVTWRQLERTPRAVLRDLRRLAAG